VATNGLTVVGARHRFATPFLSQFPLPPEEAQGEGGQGMAAGWDPLTPALSQGERG
jgi:hypothetical protein